MRFLIFIAVLYGGYVLASNHYHYGVLWPDETARAEHKCETDPSLKRTRECAKYHYGDDVLLITPDDAEAISRFMSSKARAMVAGTYSVPVSNGQSVQIRMTRHNPRYCPIRKRTIYNIRGEVLTQYVVVEG